jgi:hypothetical protein
MARLALTSLCRKASAKLRQKSFAKWPRYLRWPYSKAKSSARKTFDVYRARAKAEGRGSVVKAQIAALRETPLTFPRGRRFFKR